MRIFTERAYQERLEKERMEMDRRQWENRRFDDMQRQIDDLRQEVWKLKHPDGHDEKTCACNPPMEPIR